MNLAGKWMYMSKQFHEIDNTYYRTNLWHLNVTELEEWCLSTSQNTKSGGCDEFATRRRSQQGIKKRYKEVDATENLMP